MSNKESRRKFTRFSLVSFMTLFRILVIPPIAALLYFDSLFTRMTVLIVIFVAAITDWLDGYYARRWKIVSILGRFLDPIADKLLVASVLILTALWQETSVLFDICILIIITREIIVSGLREHLALSGVVVRVSVVSKNKTAIQLALLGLVVAEPLVSPFNIALGGSVVWVQYYQFAMYGCLIAAALLAVLSAIDYVRGSFPHLIEYSGDKS